MVKLPGKITWEIYLM